MAAAAGPLILIASESSLFNPEALEMGAYLSAFIDNFGFEGRSAGDRDIDATLLARIWRTVRLSTRSRGLELPLSLARALRLLSRQPEAASLETRSRLASIAAGLEGYLSRWNYPEFFCAPERRPAFIEEGLRQLSRNGGRPDLARVLAFLKEAEENAAALPADRPYSGALIALSGQNRRHLIPGQARPAYCLVPCPRPANAPETKRLGIRRPPRSGRGRRILVVGDSYASYLAAQIRGQSFFPLIPGREDECWTALADWGLPRFLSGESSPAGLYTADFLSALPPQPLR